MHQNLDIRESGWEVFVGSTSEKGLKSEFTKTSKLQPQINKTANERMGQRRDKNDRSALLQVLTFVVFREMQSNSETTPHLSRAGHNARHSVTPCSPSSMGAEATGSWV